MSLKKTKKIKERERSILKQECVRVCFNYTYFTLMGTALSLWKFCATHQHCSVLYWAVLVSLALSLEAALQLLQFGRWFSVAPSSSTTRFSTLPMYKHPKGKWLINMSLSSAKLTVSLFKTIGEKLYPTFPIIRHPLAFSLYSRYTSFWLKLRKSIKLVFRIIFICLGCLSLCSWQGEGDERRHYLNSSDSIE